MRWFRQRRKSKVQRQLLDTQAELDAARREIGVLQAEVETMAAVIARDRQRIKAETAAYARQQAISEGLTNDNADQSLR